jgi:hypothetical protein
MRPHLASLGLLLLAVAASGDEGDGFVDVLEGTKARRLTLVAERPLRELLDGGRLEASGVEARGGSLYVVFDDTPDVARVRGDLSEAEWIETDGGGRGYEGIAWSSDERRFFCVIEGREHDGEVRAKVAEYDERLRLIDEAWLPGALSDENKGYEGLAAVTREGRTCLLALREGDDDDDDGVVRGRIDIFRRKKDGDGWKKLDSLTLPSNVRFADCSGIDVAGDRVAVVSQQSSALWLGRLAPDAWEFIGDGQVYLFPRDDDGEILYESVEGVAFLDAGRLAVVSDRVTGAHSDHEKAIHIFAITAAE